jgi:HK97 family phage major capsid protein
MDGEEKVQEEIESLVFHGDAIKALGEGKVAGYLVRFSGETDPDVTDDFFGKDTDYGVIDGSTLPVYYQHGMDEKMGIKSIGRGTVKIDDIGLWFEAQLNMRSEYEQMIYELAKEGKLGWSSGAAGHLVEREEVGKAFHIKSWPIAEASLTPTPAEPRNTVTPIKSLITTLPVDTGVEEDKPIIVSESEVKMTEEELKAQKEHDESIAKSAAEAAVKAFMEATKKDVTAGYDVEVVEDEADKAARLNPFKSAGDFFKQVRIAELSPSQTDKRLLPLKAAAGANETVPSDGGFLVPQETAAGILEKMWGTGTVLSRFNPVPVSGNNMAFNIVDETSRADGSRGGGILGYWLAEAGTKTDTKTKFRQLQLKLKKVAALAYATDELLEDQTALEAWLSINVPRELTFQTEAAIINGNGVGKPLGILQSPAFYTIERQTAGSIDGVDLGNMWAHRYLGANDYVWFISSTIFPKLMNMTIGQVPAYMPPGGLSGSPYGTILGRPVVETEYNPSLSVAGDILLAAPSQYQMISKGGVKSASSIHVKFVTDETAFRFVYRVDGAPTWNDKVSSYYASSDYVSPFVGLLATS